MAIAPWKYGLVASFAALSVASFLGAAPAKADPVAAAKALIEQAKTGLRSDGDCALEIWTCGELRSAECSVLSGSSPGEGGPRRSGEGADRTGQDRARCANGPKDSGTHADH